MTKLSSLRLSGKVCVITGTGGSIGRAAAVAFAREDALVVGCDLNVDAAEATVEMVRGQGGTMVSLQPCQITKPADCQALVDFSVRTFGRIDVLFNNAGINPTDDVSALDTPLKVWERVQKVNLTSVFLCCKHGIPHLLEGGGGSVINTASFVALMGAATSQISYTASKGGVLALSRELGVEFARRGVRVNALCPGPVATPLLMELFADDEAQAARRMVHLPMGRFAEAREISNAALFLASDESSYVTASTFLVDGGLSGAYVTPQ